MDRRTFIASAVAAVMAPKIPAQLPSLSPGYVYAPYMPRLFSKPNPSSLLTRLRPPRIIPPVGHQGPLLAMKRKSIEGSERAITTSTSPLFRDQATNLEVESVCQACTTEQVTRLIEDDAFDGFINLDLTLEYHISLRYYLSDWADMVELRQPEEWVGRLGELVKYSSLSRPRATPLYYSNLFMLGGSGLNPKYAIGGVVWPLSNPDFTESEREASVRLLREIAKASMPTHVPVFLLQANSRSNSQHGQRFYPEETLLRAAAGFTGSSGDGPRVRDLTVVKAEDQTVWLVGVIETATLPEVTPRAFSIRPRGEGIVSDEGVVTDYRITGFDLINSAADRWSPWWEPVRFE